MHKSQEHKEKPKREGCGEKRDTENLGDYTHLNPVLIEGTLWGGLHTGKPFIKQIPLFAKGTLYGIDCNRKVLLFEI